MSNFPPVDLPRSFCVADYETYFDTEYSLRKMPAAAYVYHPLFEIQCVSVLCPVLGFSTPTHIGPNDIPRFHREIAKASQELTLVGQNSIGFDSLIFAKYGIQFGRHIDTQVLSRYAWGSTVMKHSLEEIAKRLGLEVPAHYRNRVNELLGTAFTAADSAKLSQALAAVKGKRLADIPPRLLEALMVYCDADVWLTAEACRRLGPLFPKLGYRTMTANALALCTLPLELDVKLLGELRDDYTEERDDRLNALWAALPLNVRSVMHAEVATKKVPNPLPPDIMMKYIRSKDKLAWLLINMGAEPATIPMKTGKNGPIYAFSKDDVAFTSFAESCDDGDSLIPEMCNLRLDYSTTAYESKVRRYLQATEHTPNHRWGMHIHTYGAANTGRHSGGNACGACFTGELELLTPTGWVRADELEHGVPVMQHDKHTNECSFVVPTHYYAYESDDVYAINAPCVSGHFTGNHRFWGRLGKNYAEHHQIPHVIDVAEMAQRSSVTGLQLSGMKMDGNLPLTDDQLRFHAMVNADGNYRPCNHRITVDYDTIQTMPHDKLHIRFGFNKQRKVDMCLELLTTLGIPHTHHDYRPSGGRYQININAIPTWFKSKWLGEWVLGLTGAQMQVFVDELFEWDGCHHKVQKWRTKHTREVTTGRYDQAEWMQVMIHLSGLACSVSDNTIQELRRSHRYTEPFKLSDGKYSVYAKTTTETSVYSRGTSKMPNRYIRKMPGTHKVYCVTVPKDGLLVRHNDRVFTTLNSPHNITRAKGLMHVPSCGANLRFDEDRGIRDAIMAPEGMVMVVFDSSGVELRAVGYITMEPSITDALNDPKRDLYIEFARVVFNNPALVKADKGPRFVAKLGVLSLQYLTGWRKLLHTCAIAKYPIDEATAKSAHESYRVTKPMVVKFWECAEMMMRYWAGGPLQPAAVYGCVVGDDGAYRVAGCRGLKLTHDGFELPNGYRIRYTNLRRDKHMGRMVWTYYNGSKKCRVNLHPGQVLENCAQALVTQIMDLAVDNIQRRCREEGIPAQYVGQVHDEVVFLCAPEHEARLSNIIMACMKASPPWWPEIILNCEGGNGWGLMESEAINGDEGRQRYGFAK